MMLHVGEKVLT